MRIAATASDEPSYGELFVSREVQKALLFELLIFLGLRRRHTRLRELVEDLQRGLNEALLLRDLHHSVEKIMVGRGIGVSSFSDRRIAKAILLSPSFRLQFAQLETRSSRVL